jgi:hypothetical protein
MPEVTAEGALDLTEAADLLKQEALSAARISCFYDNLAPGEIRLWPFRPRAWYGWIGTIKAGLPLQPADREYLGDLANTLQYRLR